MAYQQHWLTYRLWFINDTEKAYHVCEVDHGQIKPGKQPFWVPKSQCKSIVKFKKEDRQVWTPCELEMSEWIASKVNLFEEDTPKQDDFPLDRPGGDDNPPRSYPVDKFGDDKGDPDEDVPF